MAHSDWPPRTPWHATFPDVVIHAAESAVKQHPAYRAAKSGNGEAARMLVRDNVAPAQNLRLLALADRARPILVSAHAYEREGVNAIPEVLADTLGETLGWPVDASIVQVNVVAHTGADGFSRMARQARFAGDVMAGRDYVLVDDFIGMGGTLANFKGYVEHHGGHVLAAVCLTGKWHSAKLRLTPQRLQELRARHGTSLEDWWLGRFGHGFDALTESEARYLTRTQDADTVRDRIAARQQA